MEIKYPLSSRESSRSHSATGIIYETVVDSNMDAHPDGIATNSNNKLNFPKPVAEIAVSKSAGPFSIKLQTKIY